MSRERCLSLDRAQRRQQGNSLLRSGLYIPERSPNRDKLSSSLHAAPQHIPSAPDIYCRNYGGGTPSCPTNDINEIENVECIPVDDDYILQNANNGDSEYFMQQELNVQDLPEEFLDDFEEPSFYDLPPNSSFDEVMCTMTTPPASLQPTEASAAEKLDALRTEISEIVQFGDLRKRMAAHIGTTAEEQQSENVQVDDVRRRMAAMIAENSQEPPICPYKIPALPEDPYIIPSPPKNPKDVVALVRRAQAIARLKALEEKKIGLKPPRDVKGLHSMKRVPTLIKPKAKANTATKLLKKASTCKPVQKAKKKNEDLTPQHPPDYIPDEWAAAILRTRKLAGLKTTNPKLIPKPKTVLRTPLRSPSRHPSSQILPTTLTVENIMERVAAFRSRADSVKSSLERRKKNVLTPTPQDDLDEFEALEELYGAKEPEQCFPMEKNVVDLQNRISALQQQLLKTPPNVQEQISQKELDEYETLEKLYGAAMYDQCPSRNDVETCIQDRIDHLQRKLFQSPITCADKQSPIYEVPAILRYKNLLKSREAMAAAAAQIGIMERGQVGTEPDFDVESSPQTELLHRISPRHVVSRHPTRSDSPLTSGYATPKFTTPKRSRSPAATSQICPPKFDDNNLRDIDVPVFDINDIDDFAFSPEAMADAGFEIGNVSLNEITMPSFEEDISFDELGLKDISSPDLYDLSISREDLALEPDYPLEETTEEEDDITEKNEEDPASKQPGILTLMVNAIVNKFRNIFSPSKMEDLQNEEDENELNLDTSLPNMFETTPPPKPKTQPIKPEELKTLTPKGPIVIPPHPKDPKDYMSMVKRAQAIQKKKAEEIAMPTVLAEPIKQTKAKKEIQSTIPKRAPPPKKKTLVKKKKKEEKPGKVYPPGEYSPSDTQAVARARTLAGLKNMSAVLNPERAARIAERKAAKEAELAAIEALPPVERIKKEMASMPKIMGHVMPRPSIENLGTLEAIRANLPKPKTTKRKWRPTGRHRADWRTKPEERVFRHDFGRVLIPTEQTHKKKGWRELDVMSPIAEETLYKDKDFIQFSPLKPHEGQMRLRYLRDQAAKRAAETIRTAEEAQTAISLQTSPTQSPGSINRTPKKSTFSPIRLQSPGSPRTEKTRRDKIITKVGPNGGTETIREKVIETSTIENGEVHTTTRQVTTKTDEFGNVTCHIQRGKGLSGEEEAVQEDLDSIEPPDFFETSDIPPPNDPSIPTPAEIINRIRSKVQQKLNFALPDVTMSPKSPLPEMPVIDFPQGLTDENLIDIEIPEFDRTLRTASPEVKAYSPLEKDPRMYAWGESLPPTPPIRIATSKVSPLPPEPLKQISTLPKLKLPEEQICIPPHPKDPKDYKAMVKRAQAIQKLKKQDLATKTEAPIQPLRKGGRVPISRWVAPPPKDTKRPPRKRLVLKKRVPKVVPKSFEQKLEEEDNEDRECPAEPPPLPQEYRKAVARARLIHGLKNKTAALNPAVAEELAAKKAVDDAEKAAFDALPKLEKIKTLMNKLREIPVKKRRIEPSAEIIGTLAAIRANMPHTADASRQSFPYQSEIPVSSQRMTPQTPITVHSSISLPQAPMRARHRAHSTSPLLDASLDEFEFMEQCMGAMPTTPEAYLQVQEMSADESLKIPDISLLQPYISPDQVQSQSPQQALPNRFQIPSLASVSLPLSQSLEEFENLEDELRADLSLDEFEALEAEAQMFYNYVTPKREERHWGRNLIHEFPKSPNRTKPKPSTPSQPSEIIDLVTSKSGYPTPQSESYSPSNILLAPSMRMLGQAGFFQEHGMIDEESILKSEPITRPFITPRADARPGSIYYDQMQDFRVPAENVILETSQLMPETPPKNIQERYQKLKEAQKTRTISLECVQEFEKAEATPAVKLSPIRLISPSGATCVVSDQPDKQTSLLSSPAENEWLLNIDETPKTIAAVKQFKDLEDMPFDELEFEVEPSLTNISFEQPLSPPPEPSEIINRIRSEIRQQLRERAELSTPISPHELNLPQDLPDEELFELTAPSFAQTPKTPPAKYKSPRVSLPMAWGEMRPNTPEAQQLNIPTPTKKTTPRPALEVRHSIAAPKSPIIIPPHPKDSKDYVAMVRRAQAIYKLKQKEAEATAKEIPPEPPKKGRVPISRWQAPPPKKISAKPRRKLVLKKRVQKEGEFQQNLCPENKEERECPAAPPLLTQEYRDAVARARLIHGLQNRTAALNPKVAAKIAAKKAAAEAAVAAYNALPELEKIKVRMERLRKKPRGRRGVKPTMEQIAYLEALKQISKYHSPLTKCPTPHQLSQSPRAKAYSTPPTSRQLSPTPRALSKRITDADSPDLVEFEALEQLEAASVCPSSSTQDNVALQQRIADLEQQLLDSKGSPQFKDVSLAEFEALEALETPSGQYFEPVTTLDMNKLISDLQDQQLKTPARIDPRERYKKLMAKRKTPATPVVSPIKTPEIRYSPITLPLSPFKEEPKKRAEKSTTQITRRGNNTIKEQVIETSEIINGELQHFINHLTTTTDRQGNVTCQINESKRVSARDRSAGLETLESLEDIQEPSFLDTTPLTPMERPRPKDIIERVRRQVKERYRPDVPTGRLIELRTPPRTLNLPEEVSEEQLSDLSCPAFETSLPSPGQSPTKSSFGSPDISIPQFFIATPPPSTPPLPPVSPLRHRILSPAGPIVIPPHPKDPTDFKAMCRRARKIKQLLEENEAEKRAAKEVDATTAANAVAEASKSKKKERVPISRWTAPPPKKTGKRKKLVMKKPGHGMATKTPAKPAISEVEEEEYPSEPPLFPKHFAQEVALARTLAGLKNRTAALNPKVAAREAAKAEASRKAKADEAAKLAALNAPPRSPISDYATVLSRMKEIKEKGSVPRGQPSLTAAAYLDALKTIMKDQQKQKPITDVSKHESPKTRYSRILAERPIVSHTIVEDPICTPTREEIAYSPVRFVSPRIDDGKFNFAKPMEEYEFDVSAFEDLDELEDLGEFEQPSYVDVDQYQEGEYQYIPLTPPQTPPPTPSGIIRRMRQQYEQQKAFIYPESPPLTPEPLEFPEELPEEELFDLSAPSFAKSPIKSETPIRSPNITMPYYFEETPPAKVITPIQKSVSPRRSRSPITNMAAEKLYVSDPTILGVCPGVKVKTPQGPITIPPHPKDSSDVVAMIRRAQLIQKLKAKEAADTAAAAKTTKVRVPISRRVSAKPVSKKEKLMRKLLLEKKASGTRAKSEMLPSSKECPAEPPELPDNYLAEVARARRLAGLKSKSQILYPKDLRTQIAKTESPTKITPRQPDYTTIMEKVAALRAAKAKIQHGPTARELTKRQHLINRQQRQERKRLLHELEQMRQQEGFDRSIEFEPIKTPPTAQERLQDIKSRIPTEPPTTSVYPYSPVKTPDLIDIPKYQPLVLPPTPPYQFLENVCLPDIEDISMPLDDSNNYSTELETSDAEDLEFQLAEAEAANAEQTKIDEFYNTAQMKKTKGYKIDQNDFEIAKRIEILQQQLLNSPNRTMSEKYNIAERMKLLQEQLLQTPTREQFSVGETNKGYVCLDMSQFDKDTEQYDEQNITDEMIDEFEAMERECM